MIGLAGTVRVLVATKPVDFRKGMDGLAALVREQLTKQQLTPNRKRCFSALWVFAWELRAARLQMQGSKL
jgi:hypothetical protein